MVFHFVAYTHSLADHEISWDVFRFERASETAEMHTVEAPPRRLSAARPNEIESLDSNSGQENPHGTVADLSLVDFALRPDQCPDIDSR